MGRQAMFESGQVKRDLSRIGTFFVSMGTAGAVAMGLAEALKTF